MSKNVRHLKPRTSGNELRAALQSPRLPDRPGAGKAPAVLLSACLIVKDEEKALPECLASLRGLADEVVVYDTGSTDSTVSLATRAGAKVVQGYWDDDFGRARNASLQECQGEWILWIDADERFACPNVAEMRSALRLGVQGDALAMEIYNLGDDPADSNVNVHRALRMFRRERCRWYGSIHEQVDLRPGQEGHLVVVPLKGAHIDHIGYRSEVVTERDKLARNLRLAEAALGRHEEHAGQEGVAELNVARALAAMGRFQDAQAHFDDALGKVGPGITMRATLLFSTQNLIQTGQFPEAVEQAMRFREICKQKGLSYYLEAVARRRMGQATAAVALFEQVGELSNEDGFVFPHSMVRAELAGALLEAGRPGEAADQLALAIKESPEVPLIRSALKVFAAAGKSLADLASAMPESRLDKVAAALILVPPVVADPVAEALFGRFGPKPQLLAAAIHFAPGTGTPRALAWSARLRQIGMTEPCPLIAQAQIDILEVPTRIRAALTAHAAFGDARGAELAKALTAGLHQDQLHGVLNEVSRLDPPLLAELALAAAAPGALGAGPVGSPEDRSNAVAAVLHALGYADLATQITNRSGLAGDKGGPGAQLAALGADR